MENYFNELYQVNVGEHTEKKGNLTYLSWAWAWAEVKKRHPDATYTVYENGKGMNYHTDGKTCWVKTGVTVNGVEHIEYLPVMDSRNRSILLESVTSFDINKAIQRSLTKAVARHGLGLYIYAGEDLPEEERLQKAEPPKEKKQSQKQAAQPDDDQINEVYLDAIKALVEQKGWTMEGCQEYCRSKWKTDLKRLTMGEGTLLIKFLNAKPDKPKEEAANAGS